MVVNCTGGFKKTNPAFCGIFLFVGKVVISKCVTAFLAVVYLSICALEIIVL